MLVLYITGSVPGRCSYVKYYITNYLEGSHITFSHILITSNGKRLYRLRISSKRHQNRTKNGKWEIMSYSEDNKGSFRVEVAFARARTVLLGADGYGRRGGALSALGARREPDVVQRVGVKAVQRVGFRYRYTSGRSRSHIYFFYML